jgi:hypothetical protein
VKIGFGSNTKLTSRNSTSNRIFFVIFVTIKTIKGNSVEMKKNTVLVLILFVSVVLSAQNDIETNYLLTTRSSSVGLSMPSFLDPYLSPMVYSGVGLSYNSDSRRYFSTDNTKYSWQSRLSLSGAMMLNPALSSSMTYLGANYGIGANYHFRLNKRFRILAGGLWDVDFGFRNVARNVNNPVNLDMATNLNLTGLLMFDCPTAKKKNTLHFKAFLQTPVFGYMFVPPGGASYYDMFELGSMDHTFHFSSLNNKRGLVQTYSVDVPFNKVVWRFGLHFQNLKYKANNLVFIHDEVSLMIGTTFDAISFGGKKRPAPRNFISTND